MTEEITQYKDGDIISLLVYTRNYEKGDTVSITVKAEYEIETGNKKEYLFKGVVDNDGYARLKAENKIES